MLLAVFSVLCFGASSQITITSATFPVAGDTLYYAVDDAPPGNLNVATPPGGNQLWDFTSLKVSETLETAYRPANTGQEASSFPGAELVVTGQTGETYYNVTNTKFEVMGYAGEDPANVGLSGIIAKFSPAIIERRSPLNFFDINPQSSNLNLAFSTQQPPLDSIFGNLPVNIDSLRVRINTNRLEVVDGWGTCQIPGGQYPVLRQKRTDYVTTAMDVYILLAPGFGNWVDLSTLLGGGGGGGGIGDFIGTDTTITYRFYSGTEKEEIAVATMTNDLLTPESVRFKNNTLTDAPEADPGSPRSANIQAHPNPAVEYVNFNCSNLPSDNYTLKIFNIVGKVVWKGDYALSGSRAIRVELNDFKKGTYLYSLADSKGNIIGTKRLVVLKP